ncbi:hypothetical protein CBL_02631 [Carabus blaptoides fortunei]
MAPAPIVLAKWKAGIRSNTAAPSKCIVANDSATGQLQPRTGPLLTLGIPVGRSCKTMGRNYWLLRVESDSRLAFHLRAPRVSFATYTDRRSPKHTHIFYNTYRLLAHAGLIYVKIFRQVVQTESDYKVLQEAMFSVELDRCRHPRTLGADHDLQSPEM